MNLINSKYKFTCYTNLLSAERPESILNINDLIEIVQFGYLKDPISAIRNTVDKKVKRNLKMTTLPAVTLSGQFKPRNSKGFKKHSGLMQIDIDDVANFEQLFQKLCADKYTYVAFRSPSGNGIKLIIKINPSKDTHLGQFYALQEYYEEGYQIEIDTACKDLARCMLLSWDPNLACNPFADVFEGYTIPEEKTVKAARKSFPEYKAEYALNEEKIVAFIARELANCKIDITCVYENWIRLGFAIANTLGETGRTYYHQISSIHPEYNPVAIDKGYSDFIKRNDGRTTIGTLIFHAKENGVDLSELYAEARNEAPKPKTSKVDLYDRIKEWRYKKSKELGKPAFTVFSNKTLEALIDLRPKTSKELLQVKGIGKKKVEQYGKEILNLLDE